MGGERQGELTPDDEVGGHSEVEGETTTMSAGGRWTAPQWGGLSQWAL